ncbi:MULTISPECIES: RidA family protein [Paenarthrobacter]|uniref:RidA family protein n=1 Tax=Paenarthrobacter ureafaciens TaxID=37931 RepID=A0AAX3EPW5_PAEUR|nr:MULTISPECIES: RidA family protein [Paenarthrobacter]MDO5878301.1 RidA family protein [Paenarthrobacter sp. SD-1]UYW00176.1 RidA family protein [Paenarthrobacter ureafaciens]WIV33626.1 RidA family protein [Paenarthrobacter sp. R1]
MTNSRISRVPAPVIPGISDSTRVTAGDLVFISGAVGFEQDGSVPADFSRAVELTLREVERALSAQKASFSDLVRINVYITHLDQEKLQIFRETRDRIIDLDNIPASTVIGVYSLFNNATVEIDAIAAV